MRVVDLSLTKNQNPLRLDNAIADINRVLWTHGRAILVDDDADVARMHDMCPLDLIHFSVPLMGSTCPHDNL